METSPVIPAFGIAARYRLRVKPWLAWLGIYAGLLALHAPLLRLPYYWDEAGYYVFAALDFFHHGWLVPRSTLANGHPPLLSIYLAGAWGLGGFHPWVTRAAMLAWQAALVWGAFQLASSLVARPTPPLPAPSSLLPLRSSSRPALFASVFVALAPLCFAQGSLALLDLPVAALVVWALVWRARARPWAAVACLCAAVLMKETAIIAVGALWCVDTVRAWRHGREWRSGLDAAPLLAPMAVLGGWFLYYHHVTGYWFGNPQYFAYNVGEAAGSLPRIALSLLRRLWQLVGYNGTWLLTLLALTAVWLRRCRSLARAHPSSPTTGPTLLPPDWLAVIAVYVVFHAVVGGAVLARYLLPALALYLVWAARQIATLPHARIWAGIAAGFLIVCWFWNPPYPFPYEDNLAYVQFVRLHEAAARQLEREPQGSPIWTAWPASDELSRPELGYVSHPLPVRELPDFSQQTLRHLRQAPGRLYLYSQIYQPHRDLIAWLPFWQRWAGRYYGYDPPASPAAWLERWHLTAGFQERKAGQWVLLARASGRSSAGADPEFSRPAAAVRDRR